jgi:aspartate-semialdehyde dehydrogenase
MGQNCCGGSCLFIEEPIYPSFVDLLIQRAAEIKMGNAFEPGVNFGPLGREDLYEGEIYKSSLITRNFFL